MSVNTISVSADPASASNRNIPKSFLTKHAVLRSLMADSESFNSILQKKLHTLSCFFSSKKFQAVFVCVVSVSTCKHFNVHTIIMKEHSIFLMVNMSDITNNQYRPLLCHPWRKSTDSLVNRSLLRAAGLEILIQHCKKLSLTNSKYLDHLRN